MNQITTQLPGLIATVTAHKDERKSLLLVSITATDASDSQQRSAVKTALVIDRSGSMGGQKLQITCTAAAHFVRSLSPEDRVGVVVYDDTVDMVCGMEAPSDALAFRIEKIKPGGSTDLYGGWLMGAKLVGKGGRVILLSDGQANVGRYQDSASMAEQARISYQKFGVTTTTIGVGRDYDEGLMAGMARNGGGGHYFADTSASILDAFSHERYALDAMTLEAVSVRCGAATEQLGHFWGDETKSRVFSVSTLDQSLTLRYTERATGLTRTETLALPREFGHCEEATLEDLFMQASQAESRMEMVRNPGSAAKMKDIMRGIVIELLSHSASDSPGVKSVIDRLKASIDRLSQLELNYSEDDAMLHRKRSMQSSHNLMERGKAFSAFEDESVMVKEAAAMAAPSSVRAEPIVVDAIAYGLASKEDWEKWKSVPVSHSARQVVVAMENPRDGFLIAEIQKVTGKRVKPVFADLSAEELLSILRRDI